MSSYLIVINSPLQYVNVQENEQQKLFLEKHVNYIIFYQVNVTFWILQKHCLCSPNSLCTAYQKKLLIYYSKLINTMSTEEPKEHTQGQATIIKKQYRL